MNANHKVLIFTDLDGSLLDRDTFKFDKISKYIKDLISKGIFIIPNSSKTKKEIDIFNKELDENLSSRSAKLRVIKRERLNSNYIPISELGFEL